MSFFTEASFVMDPNVYGVGKLYTPKPTDGSGDLTFTRASAATRVNSQGLIEKVRTNQLLQSNSFSTSPWESNTTNREATLTSGQSGYDGTSDAWLVLDTTGSGQHQIVSGSLTLSGVYTSSVYAKAYSSSRYLGLAGFGLAGANESPVFDLVNGTVDTGTTSTYFIDANIVSVGSGWYRCSVTFKYTGTSALSITLCDTATDNGLTGYTYTGTGTHGLYLQDAQLEQGLVATPYIETTTAAVSVGPVANLPRLSYDPANPTCCSLLLEPQRTNDLPQSDYLNGLPDVTNITITTNATTSPEGVVNASKVVASAVNTFHWCGGSFSGTNGIVYTSSIFAKADTYSHLYIVLRTESGAKRYGVKFNLANGTYVDDVLYGGPTQTSYSIEDYGGGWYRCSVSSYNASGNIITLFGPSLGGAVSDINNSFLGDGTSGIFMYGAMCESGSYPTSYIPSYGAATTRGADSASKTGISSLIGQTEGTLFAEFVAVKNTAYSDIVSIGTSGATLAEIQFFGGSNYLNGVYYASGVVASIPSISPLTIGQTYKVAFAYKNNDFVMYLNGVQQGTDTSGTVVAGMAEISLNGYGGGVNNSENANINQALLFKTRLTNADLAKLTSL